MKRGTKNDDLAEADLKFCWVIALRSEANPVIEAFGMKSLTGGSLFPVYINPDNGHTLVITGIGSTKSAAAATYLKTLLHIKSYAAWINVGIAGYYKEPRGHLFQALKVLNQDTGKANFPGLPFSKFAPGSALSTVSKREQNFSAQVLYDMEASGFCELAPLFSCNELTYVFKVVSDTPHTPASLITNKVVGELLEKNLEKLSKLVGAIGDLVKDEKRRLLLPREIIDVLENCHFTESNQHKLKQVFRKWRTAFPDRSLNEVSYPQTSAKEFITKLEQELLNEAKDWKLR